MLTFQALTSGIRATNRSFRMIALLYVINFVLAGALAWGFHSVLARTIGDSMSLEGLVKDFNYTVYTDFMFRNGGRISALLSQLTWLIGSYLLVNTLLGGGVLATLRDTEESFTLRTFFERCGTYFFRFFRLLLIFAALLFIVGFVVFAAFGMIYSAFTSGAVSEVWPFTFGIILFFLFLFVVMLMVMMADYAKVATVVDDANSMFRTAWQGIKFVFRHFLSAVGLQLSMVIVLLVAVAVYLLLEADIGMATPITILVMFLIQQVSVGFKVWTRVVTCAGEIELVREFGTDKEVTQSAESETPAIPSTPPLVAAAPAPPIVTPEVREKKKRVTRTPAARKAPARRKRITRRS